MTISLDEISSRRSRLGISKKDLCRQAEINQGTLSRSRNRKSDPTPRILNKLEKALDDIARERGVAIVSDGADHE